MNILITGASAGLGLGMAREFAASGHNLALCARRLDQLELIRAELLREHPAITVLVKQLDVSHHADVSTVFKAFNQEIGKIDRIIVNAGIGKGQPFGTGRFDANLACAQTNFIGALAQCDAAMEIFRTQKYGHLVTVSSMAAFRGQPRSAVTYAATKAALSSMSEGLRLECRGTRIRVTSKRQPFEVDERTGSRAMVKEIEREVAEACVPGWPWTLIGFVLKHAPLPLLNKMV
ncbi:MAG: short chain dehydrogenase [Burkholderiales bacterium PBB4]|nr:MAG: short chain dehydrogenase [Burkholderiales bacterium PBB4]